MANASVGPKLGAASHPQILSLEAVPFKGGRSQVAALCWRLNELGAKYVVDRLFLKQILGDDLPPTRPLAPL